LARETITGWLKNGEVELKPAKDLWGKLAAGPVTSEGLPTYGTAILVNIINECGKCNVGNVYICKDGPVFPYSRYKQLLPDM
jgi:NAD(P)H-flavin reductase